MKGIYNRKKKDGEMDVGEIDDVPEPEIGDGVHEDAKPSAAAEADAENVDFNASGAVDLTAPDMVINIDEEEEESQQLEEGNDDFTMKTMGYVARATLKEQAIPKELKPKIGKDQSTWRKQAWAKLEAEIEGDERVRQAKSGVGAEHFKTESLNLKTQSPTVEIVVATLKQYIDAGYSNRLTIYRILTYAVEAFFTNLYKVDADIMEDVRELSKLAMKVGFLYGSRGGPIRKEVLTLVQSCSIFAGTDGVNYVIGKLQEYIAMTDKELKLDMEHADSLTISMAMFTALLLRCRVKDEKIGKSVRLLLRKSNWETLKNESCFCAAELVRSHLAGIADEETIEKAIEVIVNKTEDCSSGVAFLAAVFAPLIKPSPYAASFRTACVEYLADSSEPNEQKLYGLAVARIGQAKAQTVWEHYLSRASAVDKMKNANQNRTIFEDEDDGIYNYETIVINLDDEMKEINETDDMPPGVGENGGPPADEEAEIGENDQKDTTLDASVDHDAMRDSERSVPIGDSSLMAESFISDETGDVSRDSVPDSARGSARTESTRDSRTSDASAASAGSLFRRNRNSQRQRKILSGKGIGKKELRGSMSRRSLRGEGSVRTQSKLFRRSEQSRADSTVHAVEHNNVELGNAPAVNFDSFVGTIDLLVRAKLYKNVEGVTWAVAASIQAWRTKEFGDIIFPQALEVIVEKSEELGGILPAVADGFVLGLTRAVPSTVLLQVLEAIHALLTRDDHMGSDVSDGVSLLVAAACIREVSSDVLRVGRVLDRLVSLALGIVGTRSMYSRAAGAEFLSLVGAAVPMKREVVVTKAVERLRVAVIEIATEASLGESGAPTGLYTVLGCTTALVGLIDGANGSLGLPFDVVERLGEIGFSLITGLSTSKDKHGEMIQNVCRRCGWSLLAALLRFDVPQFFSPARVGTLIALWRLEYGDLAAKEEIRKYRKDAGEVTGVGIGGENDDARTFSRSADAAANTRLAKNLDTMSLPKKVPKKTSEDGMISQTNVESSRSSRSSKFSLGRRSASKSVSGRSSGRATSSLGRSSSRSSSGSRRSSGRSSTSSRSSRRSSRMSNFFSRGSSRSGRRDKVYEEETFDIFEDSFDLLRIQRRFEMVTKDPGFTGYTTSRTGIVKVGHVSSTVASVTDHRSTARAAATSALYQILAKKMPHISDAEKRLILGLAASYAAERLSNDIAKYVEKYIWSLEVWWLLRAIAVHPPTGRAGDACFHLAVNVAFGMQYQVSDIGTAKLRDDLLQKPLYDQLLPLLHVDAFNTPETITISAETLMVASNAIASLASVDSRYGVAVVETVASNPSSFSTTFSSYVCRSMTSQLDKATLARHGNLLAHLQALLQKTALTTSAAFSIHPADIYDRDNDRLSILNTSAFAVIAEAYHELGKRCGDSFLTGLLQNAYSLHEKYPEYSVASVYLMGKLLQGAVQVDAELAEKAVFVIEDALTGKDDRTSVSAALSVGPACTSKYIAKRANTLMNAMATAMANEKGERDWDFSSNLYVPESHLADTRAVIENCGDVAAFGFGAEGIVNSFSAQALQAHPSVLTVAEEIALELVSWDLLPSAVTRATGLSLLSAIWKQKYQEALRQGRPLHLSDLWSSASSAKKIGWAIYESLICPPEAKYNMVREAATSALVSLLHAVGAERTIGAFQDLPEMLFVAFDNGCMTAVPILLALARVDAPRRFGFWLNITKNISNGGPRMQDIEINQRWESNISRYGIKVVIGKLMEDAGKNLYGEEWDAKTLTRGMAVYIARVALDAAEKDPAQLVKGKKKTPASHRNVYSSLKDLLYFSMDAISGENRNIVTITQGLQILDKIVKLGINRISFVDEFPSGRLSRVLRRLLRSSLHPDVLTTAISATGSILTTTSGTELFEDGLVRSVFSKDLAGFHLGFQYDNIAEHFSTAASFGAVKALADTVWLATVSGKDQFVKKIRSRVGVLFRIFAGVCGDFATIAVDKGRELKPFGSAIASTAFETSTEELFNEYAPALLFSSLLIYSHKSLEFDIADTLLQSVEWFNSNAPGVHLSRSQNPTVILTATTVFWLRVCLSRSKKTEEEKRMYNQCVSALGFSLKRIARKIPAPLLEEVLQAVALHDESSANSLRGLVGGEQPSLKLPDLPPHKDFVNCVSILRRAKSAPEAIKQAAKWLSAKLEVSSNDYSTTPLARYAYAALYAVFGLLESTNPVKAELGEELISLVSTSLGLCAEVGRDLDELVTVKAIASVRKFTKTGDLASAQLSLGIAWQGYEASAGGPRETKCLDRIFDGVQRAIAGADPNIVYQLLQNDKLITAAIDRLNDPKPESSPKALGALWARIAMFALTSRGSLGDLCRQKLDEVMQRSSPNIVSRCEGVYSMVLCYRSHDENTRQMAASAMGAEHLKDLEEVMDSDYVEPKPEPEPEPVEEAGVDEVADGEEAEAEADTDGNADYTESETEGEATDEGNE
ncbi:hypothetical protein NDN08_005779 [Rhodosorus marinus]|uniref:Calmodulin n=1 Tax=Rhodosorus marinus TaxID=101924 RepID=A0AAV8V4Y2_9RHOD|nr:hypothetical protein NDN08_005779 [Rhodosorus marinus]